MGKSKTRTIALAAFAAALLPALGLGAALWSGAAGRSASAEEGEGEIVSAAAEIDGGFSVRYTASLASSYTDPTLTVRKGESVKELKGERSGGGYVFSYRLGGKDLTAELTATLSAKDAGGQVSELDTSVFTAAEYWQELLSGEQADSFSDISAHAAAANALRYASVLSGEEYSAGEEYLFSPDENLADGAISYTGADAEGFAWKGVSADRAQNFRLLYRFTAQEELTDLKAKVDFEGKTAWMTPVDAVEGGEKVYLFGYPVSVAEWCFDASVTVYSGDTAISRTLGYSFNRALKAEGSDEANALWALGKAAAWHNKEDEVSYPLVPNLKENGGYTASLYDYTYSGSFMERENLEKTGDTAWVGGKGYASGELSSPSEEQGYTVSYEGTSGYNVALKGVAAEGIAALDGALTVDVSNDSSVFGSVYASAAAKESGDDPHALLSKGDMTLTGTKGRTLTVRGSILAGGKLTVSGIGVTVVCEGGCDGVRAAGVELKDGATLTVRASGESTYAAVHTAKDLTVTGSSLLRTEGFARGVFFGSDESYMDIAFTVRSSSVEIVGQSGFGIEGDYAPVNAAAGIYTSKTWLVTLDIDEGGEVYIEGGSGALRTDVSLGDGKLYVVADSHGIGIREDDAYAGAKITTRSKDRAKGAIVVIVKERTEGAFALVSRSISMDGGSVSLVAANTDGVAALAGAGAKWTFDNCGVCIKTTSVSYSEGEDIVRTNGILSDAYEQSIQIGKDASVLISDCDIPVCCWLPADYGVPLKVTIKGKLAFDNFLDTAEWGLTVQFEGEIVQTNMRSASDEDGNE